MTVLAEFLVRARVLARWVKRSEDEHGIIVFLSPSFEPVNLRGSTVSPRATLTIAYIVQTQLSKFLSWHIAGLGGGLGGVEYAGSCT